MLGDVEALAEGLRIDHDLAKLRVRLLDPPEPSTGSANVNALAGCITEYRHSLQKRAYPMALRIYLEKPDCFEERMCGYWKVWQKERPRLNTWADKPLDFCAEQGNGGRKSELCTIP